MRKFLTTPLSEVVLRWGASSAIDRVVDAQHLKQDFRGNCCVLRTKRGHMALQSYSTIVEVIFNFYNSGKTVVDVPFGWYSATTARHMRMFGRIYGGLATKYLPWWWYNTRHREVGANEYVGQGDPFEPDTWDKMEILRVGPNEFAAGLTVEKLAGNVKIQAYRSYYHSGLRYQVYNEDLQRYKRFKGVWVDGGFATKEEALRSVPENFLEWITIQRLKHVA